MKLAWVGAHFEGIPALAHLLRAGWRFEKVFTLAPEALARRSGSADYAPLCERFDVPLRAIKNINDAGVIDELRQLDLDVLIVIGWGQILSRDALATAGIGVVGAHASLLPHNRGSAPINWAIIRGQTQTGNTLMWLDPEVDAGRIIDQRAFPITPLDTCQSLYEKVAATNRDMLAELLPRLAAGETPGRPQPPIDQPILPRRRPQDGRIDWRASSAESYNFVRALTRPYPGAFSYLDGRRWTIWNAARLPETLGHQSTPGVVLGPVFSPIPAACGQLVACGSGALLLLEVSDEAGKIFRGVELADLNWQAKAFRSDTQERPDYRRAS